MKSFKLFFMAFVSFALFVSCSDSLDIPTNDQNKGNFGAKEDGTRAIPFEASFFTNFTLEDDYPGGPFECYDNGPTNYQVGGGTATHLGEITANMAFCSGPEPFTYMDGKGKFIAANGDELWIDVPSEGEIGIIEWIHGFFVPGHPHELEFHDPFTFTGGTGRFEGASGGGTTNSYVDLLEDDGTYIPIHRTDHVWSGTLILPRGNH